MAVSVTASTPSTGERLIGSGTSPPSRWAPVSAGRLCCSAWAEAGRQSWRLSKTAADVASDASKFHPISPLQINTTLLVYFLSGSGGDFQAKHRTSSVGRFRVDDCRNLNLESRRRTDGFAGPKLTILDANLTAVEMLFSCFVIRQTRAAQRAKTLSFRGWQSPPRPVTLVLRRSSKPLVGLMF